jgi:hypothetical protein
VRPLLGDAVTTWGDFNKVLLEHARLGNWGLYRNVRLDMADYLRTSGRKLQALLTFLEVSYIDSNGPNNLHGRVDPEILRQSPPFDPSIAVQAPRVVGEIYVHSQELGMSNAILKARYIKVASSFHKFIKTPVDPEDGWNEFQKQLEDYSKKIIPDYT